MKGGRETKLGVCQYLFLGTPMTLGGRAVPHVREITHLRGHSCWSRRRKGQEPQGGTPTSITLFLEFYSMILLLPLGIVLRC